VKSEQLPKEQNLQSDIKAIASTILDAFNKHYRIFLGITRQARKRFIHQDWQADREASGERIQLYSMRLKKSFNLETIDKSVWKDVKLSYVNMLYEHRQPELAETFYNSVFTLSFTHRYYNNDNIFVRPALSTKYLTGDHPVYKSYYPTKASLGSMVNEIIESFDIGLPFVNQARDAKLVLFRCRC